MLPGIVSFYDFKNYTAFKKIVSDWLIAYLYPRHFIGPFKNANQTSARALLQKKNKKLKTRSAPGIRMSSAGVPPATMVPASALYGPELTELAKERLRGLSVVVKTDRPGKVKTYLFFTIKVCTQTTYLNLNLFLYFLKNCCLENILTLLTSGLQFFHRFLNKTNK